MSDVPPRTLHMGIDPGTTQMGEAWYNETKNTLLLRVRDIRIHKSKEFNPSRRYLRAKAMAVVEEWGPILKHVKSLHIEDMKHPLSNKKVVEFGSLIEQTVRVLHPEINVHLTDPRSVRAMFGIHGKTYTERKQRSLAKMAQILGPEEYIRAAASFTAPRGKKTMADGFEAGLLAIYAAKCGTPRENPLAAPIAPSKRPELLEAKVSVNHPELGVVNARLGKKEAKAILKRVGYKDKDEEDEDEEMPSSSKKKKQKVIEIEESSSSDESEDMEDNPDEFALNVDMDQDEIEEAERMWEDDIENLKKSRVTKEKTTKKKKKKKKEKEEKPKKKTKKETEPKKPKKEKEETKKQVKSTKEEVTRKKRKTATPLLKKTDANVFAQVTNEIEEIADDKESVRARLEKLVEEKTRLAMKATL